MRYSFKVIIHYPEIEEIIAKCKYSYDTVILLQHWTEENSHTITINYNGQTILSGPIAYNKNLKTYTYNNNNYNENGFIDYLDQEALKTLKKPRRK